MPSNSNKRNLLVLLTGIALLMLYFSTGWITHSQKSTVNGKAHFKTRIPIISEATDGLEITDDLLSGDVVMPKLGNETAKAELGRAAWKLFHTTFARFPDKPTADQKASLKAWTHLFQRMYPCGECAAHFRKIIDKFPPQVSSRSAAAAWGCHVHNEVNVSLDKPRFDCANIGDFYDCGCADDDEVDDKTKTVKPENA